ncbi:DBH-like monooxygenase protein 1 homolog [Oppia nitens]|uniref:DBH-like monooxygenase protein 1 homolog n=1 Tax=Oppia nitens TaxID=1686743 RepID=UPI0023DC24DE|nr:DBH-like monooxygenase protein 1 homolog [Oppia nitens]
MKVLLQLFIIINVLSICLCQWMHSIVLDPHNKYHLKWYFDDTKQQITFNVVVRTQGWVGFGISPNGAMTGSDLVIGWIDDNSVTHFHDRYAEEEELPTIDDSQDWHLLESGHNGTYTWMTFRRFYFSCDTESDLQITKDTTKVIWAYSDQKPISPYAMPQHKGHNRGARHVHLLAIPGHNFDKLNNNNSIEMWDITSNNLLIPNDSDTTYWCKIVIAPFKSKIHVIRIEPIISPASNAPFVHHMVLYRCLHPNSTHMEQYATHEGANCVDFANMPYDFIYCQSVYMVWATGGDAFNLPENVGMPIGEDDETKYFLFEIHYDNPELIGKKYDNSGLRVVYTRKLRQYDADTITMGSVADYRLLIPPKQESVTVAGHCHPNCYRQQIPATGLHVIASLPHGHKHMRRIIVRHFRNGTELQPIAEENNYDFNFQDFRRSPDNCRIMADDHITVECTYNTVNRDKPLFGGLSTKEEMCLVFILYYPRIKSTRSCLSGLTPHTVMALSDVAEVNSIDDNDMNPLIVMPSNYADQRLSSYVQQKTFWDHNVMTDSQELIRFAPQKAQCFWRKVEGLEEIEDLIGYPNIIKPFIEPIKECQTLHTNASHKSSCDITFSLLLIIISFIIYIL